MSLEAQPVDRIQITWEDSPGYSGPRLVECPPELRVLRDFLETKHWPRRVNFIVSGVLEHAGRVQQQSGFLFPSDMEPDDPPFEGVMVFDPLDTIYLNTEAFDRLISRYFTAVIEGATQHQHAALQADWWPAFCAQAQQLQQRVSAQG